MYSYSSSLLERRDILCHISHQFDQELLDLHRDILSLGCLVAGQVELAMKALLETDALLSERVVVDFHDIDSVRTSVNEACVRILTRRQPTARDLRLVRALNKAICDFELIGNEARNIAACVAEFAAQAPRKNQMTGLARFTACVGDMLHDALGAFARMDLAQAVEVLDAHKGAVDGHYESVARQQVTYMMEDPRHAPLCIKILCLAYSLACIGKGSGNICRYVVYYEKAHDGFRRRPIQGAAVVVDAGGFSG